MKVEIKLCNEANEPYAVIYTAEVTEEVKQAAAALGDSPDVITAAENGRVFVIDIKNIELVRTENQKVVLYCAGKPYPCSKRLYEIEEMLPKGFFRISKSSIVNIKNIAYVEPLMGGTMSVVLRSGLQDYISRSCLSGFKKYIGM